MSGATSRGRGRVAAVATLAALLVVVATTLLGPTTAAAQTTDDSPEVSIPGIIPEPNSGREPEVEGDPGSTTQYLVMFGIIAGVGVIIALVVRESRAKQATQATRRSTRSEPVDDTSTNAPESSARQ